MTASNALAVLGITLMSKEDFYILNVKMLEIMKYYEILWSIMKYYEVLCNTMKYWETLWNMYHDTLWNILKCYEILWDTEMLWNTAKYCKNAETFWKN